MKTVKITFNNAILLGEGLTQMLEEKIDDNTFVFIVEEEEVDMLLEEVEELNIPFEKTIR